MSIEPRTTASPQTGVGGHEPANLGDILERVLDRGLVIVGDIRVSLLDIELLTVKLRLLIASVDTARELGIDWWQHDPWLTSKAPAAIEADGGRDEVPAGPARRQLGASRSSEPSPDRRGSGRRPDHVYREDDEDG